MARVITCTCGGNVEAVVVVNDDEADEAYATIKNADKEGDLHIQINSTVTVEEAAEYAAAV